MAHEVGYIKCDDKDCPHKIKNHAWGKIKADDWFFTKSGVAYCPDHIPDWVESWRSRNG